MKLYLRESYIVWLILAIVSLGGLVISLFQLNNTIYYFADGLNALLFVCAIFKIRNIQRLRQMKVVNAVLILFLFVSIVGIIINNVETKLALWGMRNSFRHLLFLFSCIVLLERKNIDVFFNFMPKLYWINFLLVLLQFFVLGYKGDFLGGLFGVAQGCNGAETIYLNIMMAYMVAQYLYKKMTLRNLMLYTLVFFFISALAELKGNYVFFAIIVFVEIMIIKKNRRTVIFSVAAIAIIFIGIKLLSIYNPKSVEQLLDWDAANEYMNATYFHKVTFTRNAILSVANEQFFKHNILLYIFGFGTGYCETSAFFTSKFYMLYGDMNYRQYGAAMTVLQNGYIGLILYFLLLAIPIVIGIRKNKTTDMNFNIYMTTAACSCLFFIIDSFYASLLIDMGYWAYFIAAVPLILLKQQDSVKLEYRSKLGSDLFPPT